MTKIKRLASVPLLVNDPYFSVWSPADHLYDTNPQSWTGKELPISGEIIVDDETYVFMGNSHGKKVIKQVDLDVTPTQTKYVFENDKLRLTVTFSTELDLKNLERLSEPVSLISTKVESKSNLAVEFNWFFSNRFCYDTVDQPLLTENQTETAEMVTKWVGKSRQTPLNSSGDVIDIDWGYLYIAGKNSNGFEFIPNEDGLAFSYAINNESLTFLCGYDDIQSIEYFGQARNGLWRESYNSLYDLLNARLSSVESSLENCQKIDELVMKDALDAGGETLEFITSISYRQAIAAHKLISDESGDVVFLSKECNSNGCIGTVDVSYPSVPLFLIYQPELIKGMLRPIYKFSNFPVWEFPYAPHDVGRYPYANGQVYGEGKYNNRKGRSTIFPVYGLPAGQDLYVKEYQMPIEECGNMLLMVASVFLIDNDQEFFQKHLAQNLEWADYLLNHGLNPENQLCTDDFAGHLAHNSNLSLKAITALALFGKALTVLDIDKGKIYQDKAQEMANEWTKLAINKTKGTKLAFDQEDTWSLKYNIIWDKIFSLQLFDKQVIENELDVYLEKMNKYGIPLDSRETYTKADWLMWIASLTDDADEKEKFMTPIKRYLEETETRVPFCDWYDTISGKRVGFMNRTVVGGCFMPMLKLNKNEKK